MLAISRKKGESIIIDGRIEIVVIAVSGRRVRLGIAAAADISIQRKEICLKIPQQEDKASIPENTSAAA